MPKIRREEKEEEEEEEEVDDEEMVRELEEEEHKKKGFRKKHPVRENPKPAPTQRYQSFAQQAAEGIIDSETKEVLATDIWTALANILERLERIETSIGSMLES